MYVNLQVDSHIDSLIPYLITEGAAA